MSYDQQQIIASADQLVSQLIGMDPGTRRSQLDALKAEDMVMHAVVIQRLEEARQQQATALREQMPPA